MIPGDRIRRVVDAFFEDSRVTPLIVIAFGWFMVVGTRLVYPVVIPQVRIEFGTSLAVAGSLYTAMMVCYAAMQIPGGLIADRSGERTTLLSSVVGAGIGCLLLATAPVFGAFVLGCLLFGGSSGFYGPPQLSALSKLYPDRTGAAHGFSYAFGSLGTVVLPIVGGIVAVRVSWRLGFGILIVFFPITAGGLWLTVPDGTSKHGETTGSLRDALGSTVVNLVRLPVLLIGIATILTASAFHFLSAYLPTYLIETKSLSQETASALFGLFFAGGIAAQLVAGALADRFTTRHVLSLSGAVSGVSMCALPFVESIGALLVLIGLLSSINAFISVFNTYMISELPEDVQSSGIGVLRSVVIGFGASSPFVLGPFADSGLFDELFFVLSGVLGIATVLTVGSILVERH